MILDLEVRVAVLEVLVMSLLKILYPEKGMSAIKALFVRQLLQSMEKGLQERYPNVTFEEEETMVEYAQELMKAIGGISQDPPA